MSSATRHTVIAALIFIALAAVLGWQWYQSRAQYQAQQSSQDFLDFDSAIVTDISIAQADQVVTLQKQSGQWVVTSQDNAPADTTLVQTLLNTLNNALIQATVATTTETVTTYGLTDPEVLHLTVRANGVILAAVDVGKTGAVPGTWYGRKADNQTIYLLLGTRQALTNFNFVPTIESTTPPPDLGE